MVLSPAFLRRPRTPSCSSELEILVPEAAQGCGSATYLELVPMLDSVRGGGRRPKRAPSSARSARHGAALGCSARGLECTPCDRRRGGRYGQGRTRFGFDPGGL